MLKLAIVILNWNGRSFIERFLPMLLERTPNWANVIIADNASVDDSVQFINTHYPQVQIIQNSQNYGFAGGYNQALKQIEAEYYCLLNSDIEVGENWLDSIIDYMDKHSDVGICQPKLLSYHDKHKFEYAGAAGGFIDKYGYPFCRGRIFDKIEEDSGQYDDICEIFWASGACLFIKSKLFHEIGGFDVDFFAHMEEIDLCWRAKLNGAKIVYFPNSYVYHIGGGTLPKKSPQKTYLNFRNNLLLLHKNLPKNKYFSVFFVRFFLDWIAAFKFLLTNGWQEFYAVFRARTTFYKMKKKQKKLKNIKIGQTYQNSIVFAHYIKHISCFTELNNKDFIK